MTATLAERTAAYREAARQVHEIEQSDRLEAERLAEVTQILTDLSKRTELFPPDGFPRQPGTAGGLYRLAQFPDGRGSLYVSLGFTGRGGGAPHTHPAWAAVVGISGGVETNWLYDRIETPGSDAPQFRLREAVTVGPGEAVLVPSGVYHTIEVIRKTPVLHLHAYGRRAERPGFEPPLPVAGREDVRAAAARSAAAVVRLEPGHDDLAGPFVAAATPETAADALAASAVPQELPVILAGSAEQAAAVAASLYRAGHAVVFLLEPELAAQAA